MRQITPLDFSVVDSKVHVVRKSFGLEEDAQAFIYAVLESIYPTKGQDTSELITDGPADMGIDAVFCRDHGGRVQVDLFSFKFRTSAKACNRNFEGNELAKIRSFIDDLLQRNEVGLKDANQALKERCAEVWGYFDAGKLCDFRVILVSNGLPLTLSDRERFEHFCQSYDRITLEEIDFFSVVRLLSDTGSAAETARLQSVDDQIFDRSDGDVRGVIANIDARSLIDAITDPTTSGIKRHLFNDNIRVYLGDDGGYNSEIIRSATSEDNHMFWYLNNGITIICDKVEYQKRLRNPLVTVHGLQIVNGAQTCNALFNAAKLEPEMVGSVLVLTRIYETQRSEIGQRVAISTNSQARINLRDLHSNDEIQKKIEALLETQGFKYERKKSQYLDHKIELRVDALKLGQIILSYVIGEPDKAKTDSDSIFGSRYHEIFTQSLTSEMLVSLIRCYSEIERRRDELRLTQRRSVEDVDQRRYLTYGHWHVLFVVSLLCMRDEKKWPADNEVADYVDEAQQIVATRAGDYRSVAHYDMFRSPRLKDRLIADFGNVQLKLPFEFGL